MDSQGLNVLVVEDEISIRNLMEMEFQDLGYNTMAVGTIADAVKIVEDKSGNTELDICILDLKLPDGDGLSLLQRIKQHLPHVPVILMTGHGNKSTVLEALKKGAYDYIEKPFSISNDLFPVVHRAAAARRLQKENTSLNEQILHQSKLAALGELSATVLHDIRGPLSLIQVVCDDINDELSSQGNITSDMASRHLMQIRKACDRIRKLGDHLRNYARQDKNESMESKSLDLILEDSLFLVQQKVRQNRIKVSKQIDKNAEGMSIRCFPNKFEQVVMNLLSNACDAMSSCDKRELSVLARCEGEIVFIDVRDTGTGIPKELQEKIFENFFTTKPKGEGTGLGLSIVRNIVREHGGDLILSSEPGTGTTFTIRLPISKSEEEGESASGSAHPTAAA